MNIFRLAAAIITSLGLGAQAQTPVKIIYADYMPPKHPTNLVLVEFFKNVERDSNNSIKFEWHFAQSLLAGKDVPAGVRDGVADAGYIVGVYIP
jgi:TRAP-type transport system periplasmic protein